MMQNNEIIGIDNLRVKSERGAVLLDVPQLSIRQGARVAVVGPNGSGKTTLLEVLVGLRKYSAQRFHVLTGGQKKDLGCQLQNATYNNEFEVCDILNLHKSLYQKDNLELYQELDLAALQKKKYKVLSRGEKQRVDLYVALAHKPSLIFLDEPTTGLDRVYLEVVMRRIQERAQQGTTLLVASHTAKEVAMTEIVLWMNQGNIMVYQAKQDFLQSRLGSYRVDLYFDRPDLTLDELFSQHSARPEIKRSIMVEEGHSQLFGEESLRSWILENARKLPLAEFAVAKTGDADLLRYTAWQKSNEGEQR